MATRLLLGLPLLLVACAAPPLPLGVQSTVASHEPVVRGRVTDDEGRPLAAAWVRRMGRDGRVDATVAVDADGRFTVPLDPDAGFVKLHVTGVDRTSETFVVVTDELPVAVEVKLGTDDAFPPRIEDVEVAVVPSFDDVVPVPEPRPVPGGVEVTTDLPDGSYPFILLATEHGKTWSTLSDGMFEVTNGNAFVPVDVVRPPPPDRHGSVTFAPGSASRSVNDLLGRRRSREELREVAERDARPRVREAAMVAYFLDWDAAVDARPLADAIMASVPPTGAVWSVVSHDRELISLGHGRPLSPFELVVHASAASLDDPFVRRFVDAQPDVGAVSRFLHEEMLGAKGNPERQRRIVRESRAPRLRGTSLAEQIEWLDPDRVLFPGKPAPVLDVASLDGKGRVGSASFAGRAYLVDIWKPACGLCVYELPFLLRLHRRFGASKRFGMLSIVVDDEAATTREDIAHPVPWKHGVVRASEMSALFERLGAPPSFPLRILVDAKGKVVDAWPWFRTFSLGSAIEQTLR